MSTETINKDPQSATVASGCWRIDPARSRVEFRTPTLWGRATVTGRFDRYEGSLDLERDPAIDFVIEAASLDTNNGFRDRHLRSADFFDVDNHPEVRFVSDSVAVDGDTLRVRGELRVAGSQLPLEAQATVGSHGEDLEIDARATIDHRKLGMSHGIFGMIPPRSELVVRGRLVR